MSYSAPSRSRFTRIAALFALLAMLFVWVGPLLGAWQSAKAASLASAQHCSASATKTLASHPYSEACGYCQLLGKTPLLLLTFSIPRLPFKPELANGHQGFAPPEPKAYSAQARSPPECQL